MTKTLQGRLADLALAALVAAALLAGLFEPLERGLTDARFRLTPRAASGDLAVVAIDADSLSQLDSWPWPRRYHAELIERLNRLGARAIVLDVDFSARTNAADDAALAEALRESRAPVLLPVFKQQSSRGGMVETGPLPEFQQHAQLVSVVVHQGSDSLVRQMAYFETWQERRVLSLPAALARAEAGETHTFGIDFGIDPGSLQRLSFADLLRGTVPDDAVRGRLVLVGATAIELGDILPVPVWRSLPGPLVLALAYESLAQGRAIQRLAPAPLAAGIVLLALLAGPRFRRLSWRRGLVELAAGWLALLAGSAALQGLTPLGLDVAGWLAVLLLSWLAAVLARVEQQARRIFIQGMEALHHGAKMRTIVDNSSDAVITTDFRGAIDSFNPAARRMFGYGEGEIAELKVESLFDLPGPALDAGTVEGKGVRRDGSRFDIELLARQTTFDIGRDWFERRRTPRQIAIYTVRDISARKRVEAARRRATEEAEAASRAKTEFLASMSHELRTPLNAIIGFSEVMTTELYGPLGHANYRSYAGDILRSGAHLLAVVNDILDVARIESGKARLDEGAVALSDCILAAQRLVGARASAGNVQVLSDVPGDLPPLWADERSVKQVLHNLLSNAVKFTQHGGSVLVRAHLEVAGDLVLTVSDTGIGMPAAEIPKVLQPFYQIDRSLSRKYEGTGLGLPLVKSLLELHQGTLRIDSVPGEGTTVTCRFPAVRVLAAAALAAE